MSAMEEPGRRLAQRAAAWRRRWLRRALADGAARLAAALALAFAAAVWADQAATLPRRARWALLALGAAGTLAGAAYWLVRPWLAFDWAALFEEASARLPDLRLHLRSAWELSRGGAAPGTSEALREAHVREAERLLVGAAADPGFSWRPERRLLAAGAAATLAALSLAWAPPGALDRLLRPWRDVPLESFLKVAPGDARADWGRPVTIAAGWLPGAPAGRARHDLTLWLRPEGGGWRRAAWDKAAGEERRFTVDELTAPLRYRLAWRDLETREYALTPVLAPQLESLRARLHGQEPASTPLSPAEPLQVMRGTLVTVSGRPNQPLARAALKLSTLPQAIMMREAAGGEFEASFVASEDASLRFELETPDGREDRDAPVYTLKTVADQPPTVELVSPLEPALASPADTLPIAYAAKDDGGLTRISLILRPAGKPAQELVLQRLSSRKEFAGDYALELSGLPLGRVEFQLKAVDNASPPQSGLSAKGSVDIQDLQAQHAASETLWKQAEQKVKAAADTATRLKQDLAAGKPASEADLGAMPPDLARAAQSMKELAEAMSKDAYANPGLAEEMKSAAEGLEQARQKELPAAQQAARAGASPEAAQKHERLAQRLEQSKRLLQQGRALQGMQDFYQETARMSQKGASLESKAESLSRGGKASSEEMKAIDAELKKIAAQMAALEKALDSLPKASPSAEADAKAMEMPVEAAREAADAMAKALARGDYKEAAKLARQLSEALSKVQQAVGQAAANAAGAALPPQTQAKVDQAQKEWQQLADDQAKLVERTQKLEDAKLARRLEAQKQALEELARRQAVAVSSAAAQAAFPMGALVQMRGAQKEFDARKVENAPSLLRAAASGAAAVGFRDLAAEEQAIAAKLEGASAGQASGSAAGPDAEQAGRDQASLKARAGKLQSDLQGLESETGASAGEALDALSGAQEEQGAAADALSRHDSAGALPRQQKALELLTQGSSQMSQSSSGRQQRQQKLIQPFQRPSGGARVMRGGQGGSGAQVGFVPLPSSRDYLPPKELREELERSLREGRPASQDALIKEYFKRIAQ